MFTPTGLSLYIRARDELSRFPAIIHTNPFPLCALSETLFAPKNIYWRGKKEWLVLDAD
jgi:hypothetical protein